MEILNKEVINVTKKKFNEEIEETVINETIFIEGAVFEKDFLKHVLKALNPQDQKKS